MELVCVAAVCVCLSLAVMGRISGNGLALAGLGHGNQDRRNAARKRAWEAANAVPDQPARVLSRLADDSLSGAPDEMAVAETADDGAGMITGRVEESAAEDRAAARAAGPEMKLIVDGLCLDTLRFPAHLGDGAAEEEGRSWLDITRLRRADDGGPCLREALLVALDWARDPEGKGRPGARQRLTLVLPIRHLPLQAFRAYARELELFTALVLRRYPDVVAAFEIGNEDWDLDSPDEYAAKARMVIGALETAMDALNLHSARRPDIMVQRPLPPTPPSGRDDHGAVSRVSRNALQAALAARKAHSLQGLRAVDTSFTTEYGAIEITAHEGEDRLVAYVRSRLDHPIRLDVDFASLLPWAPARAEALRIGAAPSGAAHPSVSHSVRAGNALHLAQPAPTAQPWALDVVEMDGPLLDVELAPFEAVEVTFLLGDGGDIHPDTVRRSMRLLDGGNAGHGRSSVQKDRVLRAETTEDDQLIGEAQPDEMIGWIGADRFVFGKTAGTTPGPVIRNFIPGQDVIDLVLPGLSARDIALADHEDGVMVQAGDHARFLLDGVLSSRQVDVQRDFRVL